MVGEILNSVREKGYYLTGAIDKEENFKLCQEMGKIAQSQLPKIVHVHYFVLGLF